VNHDIVIHASEPRYWYFLVGAVVGGLLLVRRFSNLDTSRYKPALRQLGVILLLSTLITPVLNYIDPSQGFSWHRSLPLQLCWINMYLVSFNCFWQNRWVFTFTAYLGITGGIHSFLTPQLTGSDASFVLLDYYFRHAAIIFVPIVMARVTGMRFPRWAWPKVYLATVALSTGVGAVNWALNMAWPVDPPANYMYMWEPPVVSNPFVWSELGWPWYQVPLHFALILHLLLIHPIFRRFAPLEGDEANPKGSPLWMRLWA
jgi:hypothetical integral membrane protein (TIGR02206 family)